MIMPEKVSLSDFVTRRLHPVRVTIQLLNHELDRNTEAENITMNAALLGSAINTLELFVEDYEKLMEMQAPAPKAPAVERKFVGEEAKKS
jgi:hypothetical protein